MINPIVLFDVWEGSLEINEQLVRDSGVRGMVVRINDMNGGHHLDENFVNQYNQSINAGLATSLYFVYNPWVNGFANYMWLSNNAPSDAKSVFVDIEVAYSGISKAAYASEVRKFVDLCMLKWNTAIYTGQWFLSYLAYWPTDVYYWWAQYPFSLYPASTQTWTYEQLFSVLNSLDKPYNSNLIPGPLLMWQCSGDRIVLPGSNRSMDINIWYGTEETLKAWFSGEDGQPPIPTGDELVKSQQWYDGCLYEQWDVNTVHGKIHTHLLTFDTNKVEEFFVTPRPTARHYVPAWLELFPDFDVAINCDQFVGVDMGGLNSSRGLIYGPINSEAVVQIDQNNNFTLDEPPNSLSGIWNAYGVPNVLAKSGMTLQHIRDINATKGHRPRTATAKNQDGSKKFFLIVDGDETYDIATESGFDFIETSEFMLRHGGWEVYMSDGGGSTTLCRMNHQSGVAEVINAARGEDYQARWGANLRRVANSLMVKMRTTPVPNTPTKGILTVEGYESAEVLLNI